MGGGKEKHDNYEESQDKGFFSNMAHGLAAGHMPGQHSGYPPAAGGYPPQGYPPAPGAYPPQHGYPPQGYPPQGYPPQGYPPQHGYPPSGYPSHSAPPHQGMFL